MNAITDNHELVVQVVAMPAHTNPNGHIFGGWVVSQMDIAGAVAAQSKAKHPVVTASINEMSFLSPVAVGDVVSCYARLVEAGRTSLRFVVDVYALSFGEPAPRQVTSGLFVYVAIDQFGKPTPHQVVMPASS